MGRQLPPITSAPPPPTQRQSGPSRAKPCNGVFSRSLTDQRPPETEQDTGHDHPAASAPGRMAGSVLGSFATDFGDCRLSLFRFSLPTLAFLATWRSPFAVGKKGEVTPRGPRWACGGGSRAGTAGRRGRAIVAARRSGRGGPACRAAGCDGGSGAARRWARRCGAVRRRRWRAVL